MLHWLWKFTKRCILFSIVVIGGARAYSWLFGYDDEVKMWAAQNRPVIVLVLALSAITYGMYVFLDENMK